MYIACNKKDGIHKKRKEVPVIIVRNSIEYFMEYVYNKLTSPLGRKLKC